MKKIFIIFALIAFVALTGCQQAANNNSSSTTKTLPDAAAQVYAQNASIYANGMISSMSGWAGAGQISPFGVKGASVGAKTITGPDPTTGYYHIVETLSGTGYAFSYDVYGKLVPATGHPTEVDIYGTVTMTYGTSSYTMAYGSSSSPFKGTMTWSGSNVTNVALNGSLVATITAPNAGGTGNDTVELTMSTTDLSMSLLMPGSDYPNGTVTIGIKYNGAAQPNMVVTYSGGATATWTYGTTSGSFTVIPS